MPKFSLFLLLLFWSTYFKAQAKYVPTQLHYMILDADLVVYGEVDTVLEDYFILKIDKKVFGNHTGNIIKVKQFQNWACAARWTKYKTGQKVFLLLSLRDKNDWCILSGGGEGELPVVNEMVYLESYYSLNMPAQYHAKPYQIYGAHYYAAPVKLADFIQAVIGIRNNFSLTKSDKSYYGKIAQKSTLQELEKFKNNSPLNKWIADHCLAYIKNYKPFN